MPGGAHGDRHGRGAAYCDFLLSRLERRAAVRRQVAVWVAGSSFSMKTSSMSAGRGRETPARSGRYGRSPRTARRAPWRRRACRSGRLDAREIPDRRGSRIRDAGRWRATACPRSMCRPSTTQLLEAKVGPHSIGDSGINPIERQRAEERSELANRHRRVAGILRIEERELLGRDMGEHAGPQQFPAIVAGEEQGHVLAPDQAVGRPPRARGDAVSRIVFRRQRPALRQERVDPGGIGVECRAHRRRKIGNSARRAR